MNATPRPWTVEYKWARAFDGATVYSHIKSAGMGIAWSVTPDDAHLIVTAINEHDALVAKAAAAEAARLLLSDAIRKYAAGVEHQRSVMEAAKKALATLDAALGDQA